MRVRVEGHTDARGSLDHNQQLSQLRAEAVRAFLAGRGIDRGRMDAQGFGPSRPIADERTPEGQDKNRRVEFVILSKEPFPAQHPKTQRARLAQLRGRTPE